MILKGSQRSHGRKLAQHLLNDADNDFVEVHEVSGFLSDDVTGAFMEIENIAKGTRCKQPYFSVSLNPPDDASVTLEMFEEAANRIAEAQGLEGQPRVMVFHEKEGRRHAHVVWSRIDAETMTAKNLPHFKNKLQNLSRDLFFEHQWTMPQGLRDRSLKSLTNVTLAEWQAAKRRGKNAIDQKKLIQQCWAASTDKASFEAALQDHGYLLAKGDRRNSHVIVCHDGEILAVSRATGLKAKVVRERLGETDQFRSVDDARQLHIQNLHRQFSAMAGEARGQLSNQRAKLDNERKNLIQKHRDERAALDKGQAERCKQESQTRASRFKTGWSGFWQLISGHNRKIKEQNTQEAYEALQRDRAQRQQLIDDQLKERKIIDDQRTKLRQQAMGLIQDLRSDRDRLIEALENPINKSSRRRTVRSYKQAETYIWLDQEPGP
ncbi:Relaxase/Mobilisation nuclease domain-containing protein [Cohaesibacter marisflavi]|uniref:Relaxase/Mobilisation nuclease domain-containing protein n=1 Tax=Cohaesibacter marisflavi TaxID=655353 RepID=A0A1I5GY06_9HYPH|nr:Relaxase/Mobilisation nuclease domain-containing protein [Cohaesibacter marisflavi]